MPFVHVHIAKGRPLEKRRRLAEKITDAVTEILELERGATQVLIHEHDRDNWAIGGELISERQIATPFHDLDSLFKIPVEKPVAKAQPRKAPAKSPRRR
jgi:4-oxalocrotonate tautomerase